MGFVVVAATQDYHSLEERRVCDRYDFIQPILAPVLLVSVVRNIVNTNAYE
jgi:hypothetical protein